MVRLGLHTTLEKFLRIEEIHIKYTVLSGMFVIRKILIPDFFAV